MDVAAGDVMTKRPIVIDPSTLAAQALLIMEQRKITSLVVAGPGQTVAGVIQIHDLWRTELF
jgi:arabinose-5-phosphate isomerase